ncbi:MAG: hypothetical protein CVV49_10440 [Spirochaetae bacterium HGW-Spirochaetae-5]|nr:MAG: hypothetical protein CVV49_10440 [Spirochaetae bacterium HGW-Spirochaetae-5]
MNIKKQIIIIALIAAVILPSADSFSEITRQKRQEIADKLYDIEMSGGDHLGYSTEMLQHLEKSANIRPSKYKSNSFDDIDRLNERGRDVDLYSLLSGGLAIRESLQLESIRPSDEGMRELNPSDLKLIVIKSHPFEKMLQNRKYTIYPLDKYTPEEFYYIHFNSAARAFESFNLITETGGALHSRFSPSSVDFMIKEKLLTQLALREGSEFEELYSKGISEIVITGSDPFVMTGSDVTLIIRPAQIQGQTPMLNPAIASMRRYFRDKYSAKEKDIVIAEYKGTHLYTENRQVWSIFLTLSDGTVIISNSLKAAEKVVDTFSGKSASLSTAPDYRYMRSIYPAGKENEDGFIYLSDSFIRHLISPQLRIKEARRMYEGMRISVLERYMIFHYHLTGGHPLSIEEVMDSAGGPSLTDPRKKELDSLTKSQFYSRSLKLEPDDLSSWSSFSKALTLNSSGAAKTKNKKKKKSKVQSPDDFIYDLKLFYKKITGNQAYTPAEVLGVIESVSKPGGLDSKRFEGLSIMPGSFSAKSDFYGRTGFMTPLIEIETGNISKREAEEYKKFAASYNSFWKDYFDPIGIRIKTEPGLTIETCILPLINNSIYNLLSSIAGGTPLELHPDSKITGDTLSIAFKVNPMMISSIMTLAGMDDNSSSKAVSKPEDIFTGEVQFHMADALPLADFDTAILSEFFTDSVVRSSEVITGFLAWSFFHPVRISLPVKRLKEGLVFINSAISSIIEKSSMNNYLQSESYLFSYNKTDIRVVKLTFFGSLIARFYIAGKDNVIHITSTEKYIREMLDIKPSPVVNSVRGNASLVYRPSEMILERDVYNAAMIENGLQKSKRNIGTIKLLNSLFPDAAGRDIPGLTFKNFGFKPVCPLGGEYIFDKNTGEVANTVYGSSRYPVLKIDENNKGVIPLYLKKFYKTKDLRVELEFTPEGIMTKIQSR